MAVAHDAVQLPVGKIEEFPRCTIAVVVESRGAQQRILDQQDRDLVVLGQGGPDRGPHRGDAAGIGQHVQARAIALRQLHRDVEIVVERVGKLDTHFAQARADLDGIGMPGWDGHTVEETARLNFLPVITKRVALLLHRLSTPTQRIP